MKIRVSPLKIQGYKILKEILILAIPVAFLVFFFYYPLLSIVKFAFFSDKGIFTLRYFDTIFKDRYTLFVLKFTFKEAFISALITLLIGFPGAFIISHYKFKGKTLLLSLTTVPFVLPSVLVALGFIILFGRQGYLNTVLVKLFHLQHPLQILYTFPAIVLVHAFYNFPIVLRVVGSAWDGLPEKFSFAAQSLGADQFETFWKVTLPLLLPAIISSFTLVFMFCFLSFVIILVIGGAHFATIEVSIYTYYNIFSDFHMGSALALVQAFFSAIFVYIYMKTGNLIRYGSFSRTFLPKTNLFSKQKDLFLSLVYFVFIVALILLPIAVIFLNAFYVPFTHRFTIQNFLNLFSPKYNYVTGVTQIRVIMNSFLFAFSTMFLATTFALLLSFGLRYVERGKNVFLTFAMLPIAISPVTIALSFIVSFQRFPWILNSAIAIAIAHTLIALPFAVKIISPSVDAMPASYIFAAESLGMSRFKAFFSVDLNLLKKTLLASIVFSFAISIGEFGATLMLYRNNFITMPVALYRFLSGRHFGIAAALGALLAFVSIVSFIAMDKVNKEASVV
jgi:thiamine transport system permease protein